MEKFNNRRVVVLIVVVFVVVLSFFVGRRYGRATYIQPQNPVSGQQSGNERQGIPPDSLPQ